MGPLSPLGTQTRSTLLPSGTPPAGLPPHFISPITRRENADSRFPRIFRYWGFSRVDSGGKTFDSGGKNLIRAEKLLIRAEKLLIRAEKLDRSINSDAEKLFDSGTFCGKTGQRVFPHVSYTTRWDLPVQTGVGREFFRTAVVDDG